MTDTTEIVIFDTTMRDGEQSPGASMTHNEKLALGELLESMRNVYSLGTVLFDSASRSSSSFNTPVNAASSPISSNAPASVMRSLRTSFNFEAFKGDSLKVKLKLCILNS